MNRRSHPNTWEFERHFAVAELEGKRTEVDLRATEEECAALARRFGVEAIRNLTAHLVLTPFASGNKVALKATFAADVVQSSVVSLDPVESHPEGEILAEFVPDAFSDDEDVEFAVDDDDPPEPIINGRIEVGELIAQHLGLAIDPFPRKPGEVFEGLSTGPEEGEIPKNTPFAALAGLKKPKN
jgi:uncharacterized metal-binding protein YceD (DUF177 family)